MSDGVNQGLLVVISGPSGVGKGAICNLLLHRNPQLAYSVSATSAPRFGEIDGISYYFLSEEQFLQMKSEGEFLEWAQVYGSYYGTPRFAVDKLLAQGKNVILELDTQGAIQVKSACPEGIFIFVLPPSFEELERRIVARDKSEDDESLKRRLSAAHVEMCMADQYDYQVINDDLDDAVQQVEAIIKQVQADSLLKGDS